MFLCAQYNRRNRKQALDIVFICIYVCLHEQANRTLYSWSRSNKINKNKSDYYKPKSSGQCLTPLDEINLTVPSDSTIRVNETITVEEDEDEEEEEEKCPITAIQAVLRASAASFSRKNPWNSPIRLETVLAVTSSQ